ncbi:alkaline phosphatase family protein [bacterium]|nr:alkaline phosphatase family protein [FCB group bacterium]MBL7190935.1 alkaline phosphatase family protein [bacterium]
MSSDRKALILGLDGASLELIENWAVQGELPFFADLMKNGGCGLLKSTPNYGSASAWPSFHTGLNPGRHGMFDFLYREPDSYKLRWMTKRYFSGKTFWQIAGEQGVKSAVINLPVTYPAEEFNGIQIAGWMTPDTKAEGFTYPEELADEIRKNVGEHIFAPSVKAEVNRGDYEAAFKSLKKSFEYKLRLCRYLMKKYPVQIFAHAWIATDQAGHYFWHLIDNQHPRYNIELAKRFGDYILKIYQMSDRALKELHEEFGGTLMVMSDHGHNRNSLGSTHMKSLLNQAGLMHYRNNEGKKGFNAVVGKTFDILQGLLGRRIKRFLIAHFPQAVDFALTSQNLADIDWSRTKVYHSPAPSVNIKGREPEGIVDPAEREKALCEAEKIFYSAKDTRTGKSAVLKVLRKENVYHGQFVEGCPDLVIVWNQDVVLDRIEFEYQGKKYITEPHYTDHRSGDHSPYGIFFLKGEGVKEGFRNDKAEIIDLCPTVLYLTGCEIPSGLDGKLPEQFFLPQWLKANTPKYSKKDVEYETAGPDYATEEEKEAAEKRLKDLGYL